MFDSIAKATRKPLSVVMSALLVTLLVPTIPATNASAYAEGEGTEAPSGDTAASAEWKAIQATDEATGLPTQMVYLNHGFENPIETISIPTLTWDVASTTAVSDPSNSSDNYSDAINEAKNAIESADSVKSQIVSMGFDKASSDNLAQNDLNAKLEKLGDAGKTQLIESKFIEWYNSELSKGENGEVYKQLKDAIAEKEGVSADKVEITESGLSKLSEDDGWIETGVYDALGKFTSSAALSAGSSSDLSSTIDSNKLTWTNPSDVTVSGASSNGAVSASFKDGVLSVQATGSGDAMLSLNFDYSKTLSKYGYSVTGKYTASYSGELKSPNYKVDLGSVTPKVTYKIKGSDSESGKTPSVASDEGADKKDDSSDGKSDSSESGDSKSDSSTNSDNATKTEQVVVPVTAPAGLSVTSDELNGSVAVDNITVEGEESIDGQTAVTQHDGKYESKVNVINLFPESMNGAHNDYDGTKASLTYYDDRNGQAIDDIFSGVKFAAGANDDAGNTKKALELLGMPTITTTNGVEVEYANAGTTANLNVKAKNATYSDGEKAAADVATLAWALPDKTAVAHTVTAQVDPKTIEYTLSEQAFRLEGNQIKHVLADANTQVKAAIEANAPEGVQPTSDCYSSLVFDTYGDQGATVQSPKTTFTRNADAKTDKASGYGNYKVVDATEVSVKKMETPAWSETGLTLSAKNGENHSDDVTLTGDNHGTWINEAPVASWADHNIAYATKGVPQDEKTYTESETLNGGQGVHHGSVYAIDGDGVICEVQGIEYSFDSIAPKLKSWEVGSPYTSHENIFFSKSQINVDFVVSDAWTTDDAASWGSETLDRNITSEVNGGATKAAYTDSESGSETNVSAGNGLSNNNNTYEFVIDGDKDVATNSLHVEAWDNAGNKLDTWGNDSAEIPMEYIRLVNEVSAPSINISWDTYDARHGKYYQTNRTMTITIDEVFFEYVKQYANDQVVTTVYRDGDAVIAVHPSDFTQIGDNTWQYELSFTDDADYQVTDPTINDIVDRSASCGGDDFTVDKTSPTMEVTFDNNNVVNGKYYQQARTATITITEHNFDGDLINVQPTANAANGSSAGQPSVSGWSASGDVHTATVNFPGEGVYAMTIDGVDQADNSLASYSCEEFVVDTTDPQIDIMLNGSAAPELSALSGDAAPSVAVHDTNISSEASASGTTVEAIGLSGSGTSTNPYESTKSMNTTATDTSISWANPDSSKPENDGVYQVIVTATDLAGRTSTKAAIWSVNRFGSTYRLLDNATAMSGQYMQYGNTASKVKDVQVEEINPSGIDTAQTSVELTKDSSNSTLKSGSQYTVEPGTANDDTTGWHTYTYTVKRDNFKDSGRYQVTMHSVDRAANVSENTMGNKDTSRKSSADVNFWVDDVKPICNIIGVENDSTYEGDSQDVTLTFEDNLKLAGATVEVNNGNKTTTTEFSADDLKASTTQTIKLAAASGNQTIKVSAKDAANNVSDDVQVSGVFVNADKFALWLHNIPLVIGTVVGAAALIALVVFAILAKKRKDEEQNGSNAA